MAVVQTQPHAGKFAAEKGEIERGVVRGQTTLPDESV
jgi:hypothetical protein